MGMVIMDKQRNQSNLEINKFFVNKGLLAILLVGYFPVTQASLFGFKFSPYVTASQAYSDNLTYGFNSPSSQMNEPVGGFITELTPGLSITRKSSRSDFNLNYRLQILNYEGVDINTRLFNQLQMSSKSEIYDKSLFLDSSSTISQANLSSQGGFAPDNIGRALGAGYTTYRTLRISPYWLINKSRYINGELRYTYNSFINDGSTSSNVIGQDANSVNLSSNSYQQTISLRNGKALTNIGWRINLNNQEQYNQGATSPLFSNSIIRFRAINGEISYRLGIYDLQTFVQSGYYDNSYPGNLGVNNGLYITPGLSWTPSNKFQVALGYGYNAHFINLSWHPSERTNFQFSYRDSNVGGSNTGGTYGFGGISTGNTISPGFDMNSGASGNAMGSSIAGTSFNSTFQHRMRTLLWSASYITSTSTAQQYLSSLPTFTQTTDINGVPISDPVAISRQTNLFNLNNNVFVSKRATVSLSWYLPKTIFTISGFNNNLSYNLSSSRPQEIYGFNASVNWRFAQRMNATVQGTWQTSQYTDSSIASGNGKTEYSIVYLSISRQLSAFATAYLQYNHYSSVFGGVTGDFNSITNSGNYDSNRITASINLRF